MAAAIALMATPVLAEPLPVKLADGAAWTMTVERSREESRPGRPVDRRAFTSRSTMQWTSSPEGGQLIVTTVEAKPETPQSAQLMGFLVQSEPVRFSVDETLSPESVRNLEIVISATQVAMAKAMQTPSIEAPSWALPTPEQAVQFYGPELILLALGQGANLALGEPSKYQDRLPNPLGGPPIRSDAAFELTNYDAKAGRAVVTWRQAFDPESATKSIVAGLENLGAKVAPERAAEAKTALATARVKRSDTCQHEIDIPTGLAVRATCESITSVTVQGETGQAVDRWTITQSLPKTEP